MKIEEFYKELENNNIRLSDKQKEQFKIYCEYLLEYNSHTNLTAIRDEESVYLKHFLDSASIGYLYKLNKEKVLDIGTGAGFPGVVLKILFPNIELTLIDSNNKKTTFLTTLLKKLNIEDVLVINDRVENLKEKEYFDIITSRAVSELRILAELSLPYLKIGGYILALKAHIEDELNKALDTIDILGGDTPKVVEINMPFNVGKRCIIKIRKIKLTNNIYPRTYDKILKKPLKKNYK